MGLRRFFARWASPISLMVGAMMGLLYALLVYWGDPNTGHTTRDARLYLAVMFLSAGVFGTFYFEKRAYAETTLPFIVETLRYFFLLWAALGLTQLLRVFADDPQPERAWALYLITFIIGWIAGTVWTMAAILVAGIRYDVGQWEVVRFPAWILLAGGWAWRTLTRRRK